MRLQTTCKLDKALSGFKIIEFLVRKEQSVFGRRVHRGQWGLFGFPPRKWTIIYPRPCQKTCRCLGTILFPSICLVQGKLGPLPDTVLSALSTAGASSAPQHERGRVPLQKVPATPIAPASLGWKVLSHLTALHVNPLPYQRKTWFG